MSSRSKYDQLQLEGVDESASVNYPPPNGQQNVSTSPTVTVPIADDFDITLTIVNATSQTQSLYPITEKRFLDPFMKQISTFDELSNILEAKKNCFIHFKVKRKRCVGCCTCIYHHHFILYNFTNTENTFKGTIAHYTSNGSILCQDIGVAKFIKEEIEINDNDNFDFEHDLKYTVCEQTFARFKRIDECIGDKLYDCSENNCEHAVNYILYGSHEDKESDQHKCCTAFCNIWTKIKEVGLKSALIIALLASLAATFTRYSYVRLTMMTILHLHTKYNLNETDCSAEYGKNIIEEAKRVLREKNLPNYNDFPDADRVLNEILQGFDNSFVRCIAKKLSDETRWKTFPLGVLTALCVESIFLLVNIIGTCSILPRVGWSYLWKSVIVRLISGFSSVIAGTAIGAFWAQTYCTPPAGYFVLVCFVTTLFSKYFVFVIVSFLWDCCSCSKPQCKQPGKNRLCLTYIVCIVFIVLFCGAIGFIINIYID